MQGFSDWLSTTWLSHLFADHIEVIVISQTIHILGVAAVMISVAAVNLRILGVAGNSQSVSATVFRYTPWIRNAMIVLLLTGILQTLAEPAREIMNVAFRIKLVLLILVVWISVYYVRTLRQEPNTFDAGGSLRTRAVSLAVLSLFLWVGIIVCGRLVAYVGAIYA